MLDVKLLVVCIAILIASLLYIFFWNRFVGFILGLVINIALWDGTSSSIWIEFGSVSFSFLAGRILVKDLKYYSNNQSIKMVKCQISWRYWIRKTAHEEDVDQMYTVKGEPESSRRRIIPCRIHLAVEGLELSLYNRMPAYEAILSGLTRKHSSEKTAENSEALRYSAEIPFDLSEPTDGNTIFSGVTARIQSLPFPKQLSRFSIFWKRLLASVRTELPDWDPKKLLPFSFEVKTAAMFLGNASTESLFVGKFNKAWGTYGIIQSRSKLDLHRQLLRVSFSDMLITCVDNIEYRGSMIDVGQSERLAVDRRRFRTASRYFAFQVLCGLLRGSGWPIFHSQSKVHNPVKIRKQKSKKGIDDSVHVGANFSTLEYAIDRRILETHIMELTYYVDSAGYVPENVFSHSDEDHGNDDLPPEWGLDLVIHDGSLRYGPWADRQRAQAQRVFFPMTFHRLTPTSRRKPGDRRIHHSLDVFIELRGATSLHIPLREASKDWQWDGKVNIPRNSKYRQAGSLEIRSGNLSSVKYIAPLVISKTGYTSNLNVHLEDLSVTSSVNDITLLGAESLNLSGSLPTPLDWDRKREWTFQVGLHRPSMYIIRDHMNLFTDLAKDWGSGPPADYQSFIPINYSLKLDLQYYELNLYANDHNIIDKPLSRDDNALFTLGGTQLSVQISIPSDRFRPEFNTTKFSINAPELAIALTLPKWNTHALNATHRNTNIGHVSLLEIDATYTSFATVQQDFIDQLKLDIKTRSPALKLFGWVIRHFMVLRENYFGSFSGFSTSREYIYKRQTNMSVGDPVELKYRQNRTNLFQLQLAFIATDGCILLPAALSGYERFHEADLSKNTGLGACVFCKVPQLHLQIRLNDFYMELALDVTPFSLTTADNHPDELFFNHRTPMPLKEHLFLDGLTISANRLFGPQPRTSTYLCVWQIGVGDIKISMTAAEGRIFLRAINAITHNFVDPFNAPASSFLLPLDPDVTFLKVSIGAVDGLWNHAAAILRLSLCEGLQINFNNLAGKLYGKVTSIAVPDLYLHILCPSHLRDEWLECASFRTAIFLDIYSAAHDWRAIAEAQKSFLRDQDSTTGRAQTLTTNLRVSSCEETVVRGPLYLPKVNLPHVVDEFSCFGIKNRSGEARKLDSDKRKFESGDASGVIFEQEGSSSDIYSCASHNSNEEEFTSSKMDAIPDGTYNNIPDLGQKNYINDDIKELIKMGRDDILSYWRICRRYRYVAEEKPSEWVRVPFIMTKVGLQHRSASSLDNERETLKALPLKEIFGELDDDSSVDLTSIRLATRRTEICLTPLFVNASIELLQDLFDDHSSPELQIDSLMYSIIGTPPHSKKLLFDIFLPSIRMTSIQRIMPFSEAFIGDVNEVMRSTSIDDDVVSSIELCASGVYLTGKKEFQAATNSQIYFQCNLDEVSSSLCTAVVYLSPEGIKAEPELTLLLSIENGPAELSLRSNKISLKLESTIVLFSKIMPQMTITTLDCLAQHISRFSMVIKNGSNGQRVVHQRLIMDVVNSISKRPTMDFLSTIQPSFLVQIDEPGRLRQDSNWKFLFRLRDTLRYFDEMSYESLRSSLNSGGSTLSVSDFDRALDASSLMVDGEKLSSSKLKILKELFEQPQKSPEEDGSLKEPSKEGSISFELGIVEVEYRDSEVQMKNLLSVDSIFARFDNLNRRVQLLAPLNINSPRSSVEPTREESLDRLENRMAIVKTGDIHLDVSPNLLGVIEHIEFLQQKRKTRALETNSSNDTKEILSVPQSKFRLFELTVSVRKLLICVSANQLVVELSTSDLCSSTIFQVPLGEQIGMNMAFNQALVFDELAINAMESLHVNSSFRNSGILAAVVACYGLISFVHQRETATRSIIHLKSVQVQVPRSALHLYHSLEAWRDDYYQAGIDRVLRSLPSDSGGNSISSNHALQFQLSLDAAGVSLQIMHGTWLSWQIKNLLTYTKSTTTMDDFLAYAFDVEVLSQTVAVTSPPDTLLPSSQLPSSSMSTKLDLPSIRISGSYSNHRIEALALLDAFHIRFSPNHWDRLLSIQQKFGSDFQDLIILIGETRRRRSTIIIENSSRSNKVPLLLNISGRWKGFRIALAGPSSTQFLECQDLNGTLSNLKGKEWAIDCSDLAASFTPESTYSRSASPSDRSKRAAFMTVDIKVRGGDNLDRSKMTEKHLDVTISRVHAVMHPSSIGELGDFFDHLQAELLARKEQRVTELQAIKEKARMFMQTFNINSSGKSVEEKTTFLANRSVKVSVMSLCAAFPLLLEGDHHPSQTLAESRSSFPVRAFLFYIKSFGFETHRGETGEAILEGLSFQFVPRFRQSEPKDFVGMAHHTRNRLIYPQMTAHVRASTFVSSRKLFFGANISGFILDVDPSITDYIFSLVDVYREGKNRVEKLTTGWTSTSSSSPHSTFGNKMLEARYDSVPTTNIQASLIFLSGQIHMHAAVKIPRSNSTPVDLHETITQTDVKETSEIFRLPEVSVWCEFRAISALEKLSSNKRNAGSTLMFKCTIYSSQNTLRPSLLPFLTELVSNVERRMQKSPWHPTRPPSTALQEVVGIANASQTSTNSNVIMMTSMRINFSLRIDRSKLELTCKPDVNVVAGLHWESGGFVLNISPGAQRLSLTGAVDGLTARLRHGFLSEDCARVDARNLTFSVTFSKSAVTSENFINSISIIMDTEISSSIRFTRLQDLLCFKAVWLDRIPVFNIEVNEPSDNTSQLIGANLTSVSDVEPGFATTLIFRVRHIVLEADLGQSITTVTLTCSSFLVRTLINDGVSDFSIFVANVELQASGNLSGHAKTSDFVFDTVRVNRSAHSVTHRQSKMLELAISTGELEASLESDEQWLLQYRAEPLKISVFDNWDLIDPSIDTESRILHLHFQVTGNNVVALMTIGTIPNLIMYAGKFKSNLEAQQEGASRESNAFRSAHLARPDNVLTDVANAMLHNARSKLKASGTLTYTVAQHVSMDLVELLFVLFPRALDDTELARFVGRNIKASLDRVIDSQGNPSSRDLSLSLSHMAIAQLIKHSFEYATKFQLDELMRWSRSEVRGTQQNTIFSLPAVDMHMVTTEELQGERKLLFYDFESRFIRQLGRGDLEDINITLNLSLYSWLTGLNKAFSGELQRAQEYAEWRPNRVPVLPISRRKGMETTPIQALDNSVVAVAGSSVLPVESPSLVTLGSPKNSRLSAAVTSKSMITSGSSGFTPDVSVKETSGITYVPRTRHIERLTVRQLGEATPDVMHPFFTKRAGFNLETSLPQYVHEYATLPIEEILKALFKIYQKQLKSRKLTRDEQQQIRH